MPKAWREEVHARVRACLDAPETEARLLLNRILEDFETKTPKVITILEADFDDTMTDLALPEKYRKRLSLERLKERDSPS
jgi:transposase-like protein